MFVVFFKIKACVVSGLVLQNGVVHRDLKLENVLLDENCNIKVRCCSCCKLMFLVP